MQFGVKECELGTEPTYQVVDDNGRPFFGWRTPVEQHAVILCAQLNWTAKCIDRGYMRTELPPDHDVYRQHGLPTLRPEDRPCPAEACCDAEPASIEGSLSQLDEVE